MIPSNIIICNNNDNIDIFKKESPYKFIKKPYELIDGKYFNPPFFNIIILNETVNINEIDIKLLYNMILINGFLIIPKKYTSLFKHLNNEHKTYNDYIMIKKTNNIIFPFNYKKRSIDCIIFGVQKASTSSALFNLSKHPDISSYKDEIHYFDIKWSKGLDFFKKHFNYDKKITLCKNPDLIYLPQTFPLIQSLNPFTKFILFLRNPIDRAYSSWQMVKNNNWTNLSFKEAIDEELKYRLDENKTFNTAVFHYLQRGLYYQQIKEFLKWFPRQNLLVFILEHFDEDMNKEYNKIYKFLNIKQINVECEKVRIGNYNKNIDDKIYKDLVKFYKKDVNKLEKLLNIKTNWF